MSAGAHVAAAWVIDVLLAIPGDRVRAMQRALADHAPPVWYGVGLGGGARPGRRSKRRTAAEEQARGRFEAYKKQSDARRKPDAKKKADEEAKKKEDD